MTDAFDDIPARGHGGAGMMMGGGGPPAFSAPFAEWAPAAFAESPPDSHFSLYLHTPYCSHRCSFCPFYINPARAGFSGEYAALLAREIDDTAAILAPAFASRPVRTIFFGGGTPSDLDRDDLVKILHQLRDRFPITPETEITVEGRIRGFTADKAKAWADAGANRYSLGVQSTHTALRRKIGRLADRDEIRSTLAGLHASGTVVIIDLIYGFPGQTPEMLVEDIRFVAEETGIHGLDLYELKQFPSSPLAQAIAAGHFPPAPDRAGRGRIYAAATEALARHGFEHFTRKHWRRSPRERSLYNRTALSPADLVPFGSGAGGRIGRFSLSQHREITRYAEAVSQGQKPLAAVIPGAPRPPRPAFRQILSLTVEECALPALHYFPEECRDTAGVVLRQWAEAGLLKPASADDTLQDIRLSWRMTRAGAFWAEHLQSLLNMLASLPKSPP
jgi:oxygen-independent coproporphyrinogen-3 oxidase